MALTLVPVTKKGKCTLRQAENEKQTAQVGLIFVEGQARIGLKPRQLKASEYNSGDLYELCGPSIGVLPVARDRSRGLKHKGEGPGLHQ